MFYNVASLTSVIALGNNTQCLGTTCCQDDKTSIAALMQLVPHPKVAWAKVTWAIFVTANFSPPPDSGSNKTCNLQILRWKVVDCHMFAQGSFTFHCQNGGGTVMFEQYSAGETLDTAALLCHCSGLLLHSATSLLLSFDVAFFF